MIKNYQIIIKKGDNEIILHSAKEFFENKSLSVNDIVESVFIQYESSNKIKRNNVLSKKPLGCLLLKDLMIKI